MKKLLFVLSMLLLVSCGERPDVPSKTNPQDTNNSKNEETETQQVGLKNPYSDYGDVEFDEREVEIINKFEAMLNDEEKSPAYRLPPQGLSNEELQAFSRKRNEDDEIYIKQCKQDLMKEYGITSEQFEEYWNRSLNVISTHRKSQFDIFNTVNNYMNTISEMFTAKSIEINPDLSTASEKYVVIVNADWIRMNKTDMANKMMRMHAASIANSVYEGGYKNVNIVIALFHDVYNDRDVKFTWEWNEQHQTFVQGEEML